MRNSRPGGTRGIALLTAACSLIGGGAVVALALTGLLALDGAAAAPAPTPTLQPPAAVVVRAPAVPSVTAAPTAPEWTATLPPASR